MLGGAHPAASELGSGGGADSAATPQRSGGVLSPPRHTQHYCVQKGHCATWREKTSGWMATSISDLRAQNFDAPPAPAISAGLKKSFKLSSQGLLLSL